MLRESFNDNSRNIALLFNPRTGVRLTSRTNAGQGSIRNGTIKTEMIPCWLKLIRKGDIVTGFHSIDGKKWEQVGLPVNINMPDNIFAGLAVTAGNRDGSRNHTSTFDHVEIK